MFVFEGLFVGLVGFHLLEIAKYTFLKFCTFEKIRIIDKYFGFLTRLDNVTKKKLIVKLTESLEVKEKILLI